MSLYREARSGRRRLWLAAGAALAVLAIVLGLVAAGGEPSPAEKLASLRDDIHPALAALELVPIHYESANPTTHAAAADQLAVARETVEANADELRALDPDGIDTLLDDLERLDGLVRTTGRTADVQHATREAATNLRQLVQLD